MVLPIAALLALAVLLLGLVSPWEVPTLLDVRLLELFAVLTIALACTRESNLLDRLVAGALSRVRSERGLALAAVAVTGALSAAVTNDVALFLVVPFTLTIERIAPGFDPTRIVVLEISAANLLGCLLPSGNPQNLFLFSRGGFTPASFLRAQAPWVAVAAILLFALVPLLVPRRDLPPAPPVAARIRRRLALAGGGLLGLQILAILGGVPRMAPLAAAVPAVVLLGRRVLRADFSLVALFSALFVAVEGLRRSVLAHLLDPALLGGGPPTFVLGGALLSQAVSNVPAALLLAPAAAAGGGGPLFTALLYGVNAGGCGTPVSSIANLIGADLFLRGRRRGALRFWAAFLPVSFGLLLTTTLVSLLLLPSR